MDIPTELHNTLTDLQGGSPDECYHFSAAEHAALQDLYDGDGMRDATVKELHFRSFDPTPTQWSNAVEIDGDLYLAVNAHYDEATTYWMRVDNTKFAYLMCVHSKNDIAGEVVGGFGFWRATPDGTATIGNWTHKHLTVGGWENAYIVTEDRNLVAGGMNIELDGSGDPPFSRFTSVAGNDTNPMTMIQRNSWYEASDQWGRDRVADSIAFGMDSACTKWFWWRYPSGSASPWATAAWIEVASLTAAGLLSLPDISLSAPSSIYALSHDSFADFVAAEHVSLPNTIAAVLNDHNLAVHSALGLFDQSSDVNHDLTTGFVANEHIDWTNTSSTLQTSGAGRFSAVTINQGSSPTLILYVGTDLLGVSAYQFYASGSGWGQSYAFRSTGATQAITGSASKGIDLGTSARPFDDIYGDDFVNKGALDFSQADALALVKQHPSQPKPPGSADEHKSQFAHAGLYAKELDPASLPKELTGYYGLREKFEKFTDPVWVQANIPTEDTIRDAKGEVIELTERPMTPAEAEAFAAEQQKLRRHPDDVDPQEWGISVNQMVSFNYRAIAQLLQRIEGIDNQLAGLLARAG